MMRQSPCSLDLPHVCRDPKAGLLLVVPRLSVEGITANPKTLIFCARGPFSSTAAGQAKRGGASGIWEGRASSFDLAFGLLWGLGRFGS